MTGEMQELQYENGPDTQLGCLERYILISRSLSRSHKTEFLRPELLTRIIPGLGQLSVLQFRVRDRGFGP